MKLSSDMLGVMRKATQLLQQGRKGDAAGTIQRVLQQVLPGGMRGMPSATASPTQPQPQAQPSQPPMKDINPPPAGRPSADHSQADAASDRTDHQQATEAHTGADAAHAMPAFVADLLARLGAGTTVPGGTGTFTGFPNGFADPVAEPTTHRRSASEQHGPGTFLSGSITNAAGTRRYKLYVPTAHAQKTHEQRLPLVVMLHGCTQSPDDFAAGTEMNAYAERTPCLVLYPEQSSSANSSKCWNWFKAIDQQRGQGEPSIIADMTREIIAKYPVDTSRVYVAGLSAGGAMAAIMGSTYPELYAAVGIHSGLPYAAASDLPSAMQAMRSGMNEAKVARAHTGAKPIIVFHGDRDTTVHPRNGEQLIAQNVPHNAVTSVVNGGTPGGLRYTRTIHQSRNGLPLAEQWLIHGAGHAWSGGSSAGSYTEQRGPHATQEMMRFFTTRTSD